jgi:hypothetical protein
MLQQLRTGSPVNGAIHTAATEQGFVRRIHDGIHGQRGNVVLNDSNHVTAWPKWPMHRQRRLPSSVYIVTDTG